MNLQDTYQYLSNSFESEIFTTSKENDIRNDVLSFLLKYVKEKQGKIDYSEKVYVGLTLIDLILKSQEVQNQKGKDLKIQILTEILMDEVLDYLGRDKKELNKIMSHPVFGVLLFPVFLERVEKDKEKGIVQYAQNIIENLHPIHFGSIACYYAYGQKGLWTFTAITMLDEYLIWNGWFNLHWFSSLAAGRCMATGVLTPERLDRLLEIIHRRFQAQQNPLNQGNPFQTPRRRIQNLAEREIGQARAERNYAAQHPNLYRRQGVPQDLQPIPLGQQTAQRVRNIINELVENQGNRNQIIQHLLTIMFTGLLLGGEWYVKSKTSSEEQERLARAEKYGLTDNKAEKAEKAEKEEESENQENKKENF